MGSLSSPNLIKDVYTQIVFRKSDGKFYRDDGTNDVELFNPSVLDEDNMASNSATSLATQQSIKAYVDTQLTAEDLDISADSGSNIAIDLDSEVLAISGGEGIDTSVTGNAVTIAAEEASTSNKGVASFSSDNFAVSSGAVTIKDGGVILGTETTGNYVATAVAGEGIDVSGATGNVTISSEDATSSNKGIASFSTDNFSVSSGAVTIKDDGVILGTETSGNYVGTITGGTGIDSSGATSGEGIGHTLSLDLNELSTETTIADADFIAMVDATDDGSGKITFENLEDAIFSSVSGDIAIAEDGVATIQANSVALTTDTTGNYMVDVSAGSLIDVSHSAGEGSTATVNVDLTEAGEAAIANGDYILFLDGGATGTHAKEALADVATLFAGTGMTATNSVLNVIGGTGITANANEITTTDSEIVHDNLSGFVANEHIDHSGVTLTAGVGLSGGGTIASNRTFTVDLNELTTETSIAQADFVTMVDATDDGSGKITFSNLEDTVFGNVSGDIAIAAGGAATIQANSVALGNDTTGNYVATIAGTSNEITVSGSGSETAGVTIGLPDDVTIAGDLTVNGDTTTINTATLSVEDPLIILANGNNSADSVDIGFYGLYDTSGSQDLYAGMFRDANDSGKFKLFKDLQAAPTTTVNTGGTGYAVGTLVANLEGDVTGTASLATSFTASANNSTNETVYPVFVDGATGTQGAETDTGLTYNPSSGLLTATAFSGNLTGNVTGNASGTAATVTGAAQTNITSLGTLTTLTVDNVIINATTIGHTSDTDLMTLADGVLTVAGEVSMTTLDIGGTNVTTTAAELNLIDGGTARGTTAVASGDGILINDGGTMRMTNVDTVSTYFSSHNVGGGNIVTTGALNSGSITSGFGSIDTGSSTITTTGLISGGSLDIDNVLINGTTIGHTDDTDLITVADGLVTVAGEISVTTLDIGGTNVTSTAAELNALDGITAVVGELNALDLGSTAVGTAIASKAVILDSNKDYTGLRNLTITGELDAATLDISGDVDIDGTLETDNLTVGGAQGSDGQVLTSTGSGVGWEDSTGASKGFAVAMAVAL